MLVPRKFCLSVATSGQVNSGLQDLPQPLWETTFVTGTGSPVALSPSAEEAGERTSPSADLLLLRDRLADGELWPPPPFPSPGRPFHRRDAPLLLR